MSESFEFKIMRPFGPSIAKTKIPKNLLDKMNNYIDETIKVKKKINKFDHGPYLAGDVTQEFTLEKNFVEEIGWIKFLSNAVYEWIKKDTAKEISEFRLISTWIVRQFKNEYNPIHTHSGHVSGVGYLKVPNHLGATVQKNKKNNFGGHLNFIYGSQMFVNSSSIVIKPEVGDFYLFPNYLMHQVYPFKDTNEERRSVSFNAKIDQSIYDVY